MDRVNKECITYVLDYLHYGTKLKELTVDFWFHIGQQSPDGQCCACLIIHHPRPCSYFALSLTFSPTAVITNAAARESLW